MARNWRCRQGEIDLIVRRGRMVVFCEVKARGTLAFGAPVEAVTRTKQVRLRQLATRWLSDATSQRLRPRPLDLRFDVASVLDGQIEVIEGAF